VLSGAAPRFTHPGRFSLYYEAAFGELPRVNIADIRRGDPIPMLDRLTPNRLSRQLRRLRDIGVVKRVKGSCRYYLTRMGRAATAALCRVTESIITPKMA